MNASSTAKITAALQKQACLTVALVICAAVRAAAEPAAFQSVIQNAGIASGTQVDLAVVTRERLCFDARYSPETGLQLIDDGASGRSRFHAASISKLFTATVILQLRDEGRLSLRDPVSNFVPEFAGSPILIEQLLTHTSGLRDRERAQARTTRAQWDEYVQRLSRQRLASEPGAQWAYADAGFNLLGRVIENITDKNYAAVMRERLLEPLGMSISTFDLSQVPEAQRVRATDKRGRALVHPWDLAFLASSGLQTDARDLARFGREMLAIDAGRGAQGVLRVESLREMTTPRMATEWPGISQAYGWQLQGSGPGVIWRHAGGEAGFESLLSLSPEDGFGVIVMGNRKDWPRFELGSALANQARAGCRAD